MTCSELIDYGARYLVSKGVEDARVNCQWMLSYSMNLPRLSINLESRMEVGEPGRARFMRLLERKSAGEPLSHILGEHDFMGICLNVNPDVFIPRPETEQLVEAFLGEFHGVRSCRETVPREVGWGNVAPSRVSLGGDTARPDPIFVDIGTGSGCIAIAVAREIKPAMVVATDISASALECASRNVERHGLSQRVKPVRCDLCLGLELQADAVISNPPYIPGKDLGKLPMEVLHEPRLALDGGEDGLSAIRKIISSAHRIIKPDGLLCMEIGDGQSGAVAGLFENGFWDEVKVLRDYSGIDRFVFARAGSRREKGAASSGPVFKKAEQNNG